MATKKSKTESGHAVNLGSLKDEINLITKFGVKYNPSNLAIGKINLKAVYDAGMAKMTLLNSKGALQMEAINDRSDGMAPLSKLMTRIGNEAASSDVPASFVKDVKSLTKKISGIRASKKIPQDPNTPPEEIIEYISASQMGIDNRLNHFEELIALLGTQVNYNPNEVALKVVNLTTLLNNLRLLDDAVSENHAEMVEMRIERDEILYKADGGANELGGMVKKYVKAVWGGDSVQYHQISKCKFTKPKK